MVDSVIDLAVKSSESFPEEIVIRFDLTAFLYQLLREPPPGRRNTVVTSLTNQTGVE